MSPEVSKINKINTLDGGAPRRTSERCENRLWVAAKHSTVSLSFTGANPMVSGASPVVVVIAGSQLNTRQGKGVE